MDDAGKADAGGNCGPGSWHYATNNGNFAAASLDARSLEHRPTRESSQRRPRRASQNRGPADAPLRFSMSLLWHERTHHDPAAAYFRQLVAKALAKSAPRSSRGKA